MVQGEGFIRIGFREVHVGEENGISVRKMECRGGNWRDRSGEQLPKHLHDLEVPLGHLLWGVGCRVHGSGLRVEG